MATLGDEEKPIVMVYHEELGSNDEGATDEEVGSRILYFYPPSVPLGNQLKWLNFCQGIVGLTSRLEKTSPLESIRTQNRVYVFEQCEKNVWWVLGSPAQERAQDPAYRIEDSLQAILIEMYKMFCLFHGSVSWNLNVLSESARRDTKYAHGWDILMQLVAARRKHRKLNAEYDMLVHEETKGSIKAQAEAIENLIRDAESYCPAARLTLKLNTFVPSFLTTVDFDNLHVFYDLDGFHFFPVDRMTYLLIQTRLNQLTSNVTSSWLHSCAFLFDGHMICSSINQETLLHLYRALRLREQERELRHDDPEENETTHSGDVAWCSLVQSEEPKLPRIWGTYSKCVRGSPDSTTAVKPRKRKPSIHRLESGPLGFVVYDLNSSLPLDEGNKLESEESQADTVTRGFMDSKGNFRLSSGESSENLEIWSPKIFLGSQSSDSEDSNIRLLVWHDNRITIIFLVKNVQTIVATSETPSLSIKEVCSVLQAQLKNIGFDELRERLGGFALKQRQQLTEQQHEKFIYYDHTNTAIKIRGFPYQSSAGGKNRKDIFFPAPRQELCTSLHPDVLSAIDQMHSTFKRSKQKPVSDIYIRIQQHGWVVGHSSLGRELYVIADYKTSNIARIEEVVQHIKASVLSSIFIF